LDANDIPYKVAKETGSTVEWSSEENYCFRLSKLQKRLQEHYEMYPTSIVPATQYQWVLKAVSSPLEDLSISRPRSRLSWGIEVPGDPEQTIYVWFDALVNYLTVTGYPWEDKVASGFETSLVQEEEIEPVATSSGGKTTNVAEDEPFMEGESSLVEGTSAEVESSRDQTSEDGPLVLDTAWPADVHVIGKDIVRYILYLLLFSHS
jgi:methionyl-tRNA synthetase